MITKIKKNIWKVKYNTYEKIGTYCLNAANKYVEREEYDKAQICLSAFNACLNKQWSMTFKLMMNAW